MQGQEQKVSNVVADRRSVAAGRDVNVTITYTELQEILAHRANHPDALHCRWCGLRGQPNNIDVCLSCGADIGAERRAHEYQQARTERFRRAMADVRRVAGYVLALILAALLIHWTSRPDDSIIATVFCGAVLTIFGGEVLIYVSISVQLWLQHDLPRHLRSLIRRLG